MKRVLEGWLRFWRTGPGVDDHDIPVLCKTPDASPRPPDVDIVSELWQCREQYVRIVIETTKGGCKE